MVAAKLRVATFYRKSGQSVTDYVEEFEALVKVVETYGGAYGNEPGLIKEQLRKDGVSESELGKPIIRSMWTGRNGTMRTRSAVRNTCRA